MDMPVFHEEVYRGHTIKIEQDPDPMNPRGDCNLSTMVCIHPRYMLGDEHNFKDPDQVWEFLEENEVIWLPLYLYDHSGITMSTTPFSCRWDSGQVGVAYVTREDALKEFGYKRLTKKLCRKIEDIIRAEVKVYDLYIRGEFCAFHIEDETGEVIDSCCNIDDQDYAIEKARAIVDGHIRKQLQQHCQRVKAWIKNQVPLQYREQFRHSA